MKISQIEVQIVESRSSNESSPRNGFDSKINLNKNKTNFKIEDLDLNYDLDNLEYYVYNPYWTLRKCSSKLLDKISCIYSKQTVSILKPFLENDLQCDDWIKKYIFRRI